MSAPTYTRTAIGLHWLMAALILTALPLGLYMTELPLSPHKLKLYAWHKWLGITILGLACLRVAWRLTHRPPPLPASLPAWQRRAAAVSHALLYPLMLAVPLSGWLMSSAKGFPTVYLGLWQLPDLVAKDTLLAERLVELHFGLNALLLAVLVAHVGAALKHALIDRDGVFARMWPALRRGRKSGDTV